MDCVYLIDMGRAFLHSSLTECETFLQKVIHVVLKADSRVNVFTQIIIHVF